MEILRAAFDCLDVDGSGTVTYPVFKKFVHCFKNPIESLTRLPSLRKIVHKHDEFPLLNASQERLAAAATIKHLVMSLHPSHSHKPRSEAVKEAHTTMVMFHALDADSDGALDIHEFEYVLDVLSFRLIHRTARPVVKFMRYWSKLVKLHNPVLNVIVRHPLFEIAVLLVVVASIVEVRRLTSLLGLA